MNECLAKVWMALLFQSYLHGEHSCTKVFPSFPSGECYIFRALKAFSVSLESGMLSQQNCITVLTTKRNTETAPSLKDSFIFL